MSNTTIVLPNPYTPMAFVSPKWATKISIQTYSAIGSLAVLIWDIILHLPQDYELLKRSGINKSFIIYSIARIASFAYVTGIVIIITAPIGNCNVIRQVSLLYPFTIPLTVLLFVLRVSALYQHNKYIIALFSTTWLSVLAACIAVPIGAIGIQIGHTKYCVDDKTPLVARLGSFCPFLHDFLIFIATSWALMKRSYPDVNIKTGFRERLLGRHLPAFSKSILRDGQAYFLATLILNLFFFAMYYIPDPIVTPCTVGMPLFVLISNMSSYIYRNIRFGNYRDHTIRTSFIEKAFQGQAMPVPPSQKPVGIVFNPATSTCSVHGTGIANLEPYVGDSEKKNGEISLEETCSRKGSTMVKQQDTMEV